MWSWTLHQDMLRKDPTKHQMMKLVVNQTASSVQSVSSGKVNTIKSKFQHFSKECIRTRGNCTIKHSVANSEYWFSEKSCSYWKNILHMDDWTCRDASPTNTSGLTTTPTYTVITGRTAVFTHVHWLNTAPCPVRILNCSAIDFFFFTYFYTSGDLSIEFLHIYENI